MLKQKEQKQVEKDTGKRFEKDWEAEAATMRA